MTIKELQKYLDEIRKIIKFDDSKTEISTIKQYDPSYKALEVDTEIGDYRIKIIKMFKRENNEEI